MTLNDFERTHVPSYLHALAARARAALQRFTTFPDTTLRLELGGGSSGFVVASITTRDADAPERAVAAQKAAWFDLQELATDPTPQLAALAREALVRLLTHEVDEWLRLDGVLRTTAQARYALSTRRERAQRRSRPRVCARSTKRVIAL